MNYDDETCKPCVLCVGGALLVIALPIIIPACIYTNYRKEQQERNQIKFENAIEIKHSALYIKYKHNANNLTDPEASLKDLNNKNNRLDKFLIENKLQIKPGELKKSYDNKIKSINKKIDDLINKEFTFNGKKYKLESQKLEDLKIAKNDYVSLVKNQAKIESFLNQDFLNKPSELNNLNISVEHANASIKEISFVPVIEKNFLLSCVEGMGTKELKIHNNY